MKELISIKRHRYGGRLRSVGAQYRASNQDAKLMVAIGNSQYYQGEVASIQVQESLPIESTAVDHQPPSPEPIVPELGQPNTDLAEPVPTDSETEESDKKSTTEPEEKPARQKRKYNRRDMTAEE